MLLTSAMLMVLAAPREAEEVRPPEPSRSVLTARTSPRYRGVAVARPVPPGSGGGAPVPEATTLLLVGSGLVGIAVSRRRRREEHPE